MGYKAGPLITDSECCSSIRHGVDSQSSYSHCINDINVSFPRSLRTRSYDGEERAGGGASSVSTSEKLATLFKSSKVTDEQLQKWLNTRKPAEDVFYRMRLAKTRTWIFDNPQFSKWVQYADDLSATTSGKGTSAISILAAQYGDDQLCKMLKTAKTDLRTEELASGLETDLLKRWIAMGKDPDEVYKHLLRDPNFNAWTKYVDDLNTKHEGGVSIIPTLRKHLSDDDLFYLATVVKSTKDTENMGLKLDDAFIQFWINDKKTPAKVLAELRLKTTTKMLESSQFSLLVKYTDAYNVRFPQKKTTMIETLTHRFGDEDVATMLAVVKTTDWKAKKIATELETAQLQMWLSSGKSVDEVYDLLKLPFRDVILDFVWKEPQLQQTKKLFATGISPGKAFIMMALNNVGDSVLGSPVFTKWMTYVDDFNKRHPGQEESYLLKIARKYVKAAKLADTVEKARTEWWLTRKYGPKYAFKKDLDLDNAGENTCQLWVKYLKDFNHKYPDKKTTMIDTRPSRVSSPNFEYPEKKTTMINSIRANLNDRRLLPILDAADKVLSTEKLAKILQKALIDKWIHEKKSVADLNRWPSSNVWIERFTVKLNTSLLVNDGKDPMQDRDLVLVLRDSAVKSPQPPRAIEIIGGSDQHPHAQLPLIYPGAYETANVASEPLTEAHLVVAGSRRLGQFTILQLEKDPLDDKSARLERRSRDLVDTVENTHCDSVPRNVETAQRHLLRRNTSGGAKYSEHAGFLSKRKAGGETISVSTSAKLAALFQSSKVTGEQLQKWLEKGKSAEDVFYRMKLAKSRTWIFDNPLFSKWVQYADALSDTPSGKGTSAISTLTAQYGDDYLYKILKAAERDAKSNELASRLRTDQVNHWIAIAKDPVEVYQLYDLQYAPSRLLQNPQFSAWIKYVDDLNAKHEGAISIIPTLRKYYKDAELFNMAELAKRVKETKTMGLKLDDAFVQFWINERKTPVGILTELRLEATTKMMESPLLSLLVKFTDAYNLKFPQTQTTMIETLTNAFGDEEVTKILTAVKTSDWKAKKIATELEAAQLKMWLSSGKSVDDVYDLLKLPSRSSHYDFAGNPGFKTWIAYMNTFSIENPDKVARLLSALATQFKAERPMIQILQAAKKFPSMERDAAKLQLQLAEKVFATGIPPNKAFKKVALDSVGDSVLSSPVFTKWMNYVDDFNKKNPGKEESCRTMLLRYLIGVVIVTTIAASSVSWAATTANISDGINPHTVHTTTISFPRVLRTRSIDKSSAEERAGAGISVPTSEKLTAFFKSSKVTDEQLQKPAEIVFYRMKLAKARRWIFSNPQFSKWVQYADKLSDTPSGKGASAISILAAQFDDERLYSWLKAAKTSPTSEELASRLQNDLLKHWITIRKDPDEVYKLYDLQYASSRLLGDPQFSAWTKYVDDLNAKHEGTKSIISTLRKHYKDAELFKMAEAAKAAKETEILNERREDTNSSSGRASASGVIKNAKQPSIQFVGQVHGRLQCEISSDEDDSDQTLTHGFGEEKVTRVLAAVNVKDWKAKKIATELEAAQLQMWLNSGKSVEDVYDLLELPSRRDLPGNFGEGPLFTTWIAYMNTFSIENPEKVSKMLSTMATQFNDRPIMRILQAAVKFPSMERAVATLQLQKVESIFSSGVSPYKAFKLVALDDVGYSVLSSPLFTKWMTYAEDFYEKHPTSDTSWFTVLRGYYQGDRMDKILKTAKQNPQTAKLADMVEKARMEEWLTRWKRKPKDVFRDLHLDEAGEKTFSDPDFELWVKYLNDFNHKYPDKKPTMIDSIRANYSDFALLDILSAAMKDPSTEKLAKNLGNALFGKWVDKKATVADLKQLFGHMHSFNVWIERHTDKLNKLL
ncbi:hypothetical protein P3T76_010337 [Phytophthora citrophthora]|uniref:RxLR effector PexRD54 WY domain-containing protein n=1 Tax=Phytophthora citrophthora TaxID=4793 RepID=A0AAD9GC74_9STRA|nr:hypothetical protein P3T76_010337 [Phytophthora citrophthora]